MGGFEIISAILLILMGVVIILMVLMQESKGNGLSGAIGGGDMMYSEARAKTTDAVLAKYTKYAAIGFFVLTFLVNLVSVFMK